MKVITTNVSEVRCSVQSLQQFFNWKDIDPTGQAAATGCMRKMYTCFPTRARIYEFVAYVKKASIGRPKMLDKMML